MGKAEGLLDPFGGSGLWPGMLGGARFCLMVPVLGALGGPASSLMVLGEGRVAGSQSPGESHSCHLGACTTSLGIYTVLPVAGTSPHSPWRGGWGDFRAPAL